MKTKKEKESDMGKEMRKYKSLREQQAFLDGCQFILDRVDGK